MRTSIENRAFFCFLSTTPTKWQRVKWDYPSVAMANLWVVPSLWDSRNCSTRNRTSGNSSAPATCSWYLFRNHKTDILILKKNVFFPESFCFPMIRDYKASDLRSHLSSGFLKIRFLFVIHVCKIEILAFKYIYISIQIKNKLVEWNILVP